MGYMIVAFVILLGLYFKKSRIVTNVMSIYYWALVALNTYTPDYEAYKEMYLCCFEPRYIGHEIGYMTLCRICLTLGLSYVQFRMVIALIISVFTIKGLRFYTNQINYALALYLIFPFPGYVSGLRSAVSTSIIIYCSRFVFMDGMEACIKYIIGIGIAMLFHYSAVFCLVFLFAKFKRIKTIEIMICVIVSIIGFCFLGKTGVLYDIVCIFLKYEKVLQWFKGDAKISVLYVIVLFMYIVFLCVLFRARMIVYSRAQKGFVDKNGLSRDRILGISKLLALSLIAFSGLIFGGLPFLRLIILPIPIGYVVLAAAFSPCYVDSIQTRKECVLWNIMIPLSILVVALFIYGYWISASMLQVYQNNFLFSGL